MKRTRNILVFLFISAVILQPIYAVLKERDLKSTLNVLRQELENDARKQEEFMKRAEEQGSAQHAKLVDYMKRCEQIGIMLYSQKNDFTFDMAFACQQATDLYKEFNSMNVPFDRMKRRLSMEVERYDSLISLLEALPPSINDQSGMFKLEQSVIDSLAKSDSIMIDSLGADSSLAKRDSVARQQMMENANDSNKNKKNQKDNLNKNGSIITPYVLTPQEQTDRNKCVEYAKKLRDNTLIFLELIKKDSHYYDAVAQQVQKLNDYAQSRYEYLQQSIYKNAETTYFGVLMNLPRYINQVKRDFSAKYMPLNNAKSEWRGPIIFAVSIFMLVYIAIAVLLSNVIMRTIPWFIKKFFPKAAATFQKKVTSKIVDLNEMESKRFPITIAVGIGIFLIALSIIKQFLYANIFIMAADLMITVAWLMEVVVVSLCIRLNAKQIRPGLAIYMPFLVMAFIVVLVRIVLLPNSLINLFYPLILLVITIWQIRKYKKLKNKLPISDSAYASVSMGAMIIACFCAWFGYTLLAVQIIMWWMFQLAAIQTITCIYDLLQIYELKYIVKRIFKSKKIKTVDEILKENHELSEKALAKIVAKEKTEKQSIINDMKKGTYFTKTWFYDLISKALVPFAAVLSILFSIYWAADIFEMSSTVKDIFFYNFIDKANVLQLSLFKLCLVVAIFFLFKFIKYALTAYYYHWYRKAKKTTENMNDTLVRNVIAIIVWGGYFIFALILLQVPSGGISLVTAGLATGLGFAMKDLLENFFYGISLMTGRVQVGDFIECDGVQGTVESITYQSTQITTIDGSVMAFLNSALFSKNFKNLTRNNNYVLVKIPVGVAYGANIDKVREILVREVSAIAGKTKDGRDLVNRKKEIGVYFSDFADSSVNLVVAVWMLVDQKIVFTAKVKETIYNALNKNNIEIPFPQRVVQVKNN